MVVQYFLVKLVLDIQDLLMIKKEKETTYLRFNNITQNLHMLSELFNTAAREYAN